MERTSQETDDLLDRIQEALDSRFDSPRRRRVEVFNDRINIACPICGDSATDDNKKRGNIFFKTNSYKCYNCGVFYDIKGFLYQLKNINLISSSIPANLMLSTNMSSGGYQTGNQNVAYIFDELGNAIKEYGLDRDYFKKRMHLQEIEESEKLSYMRARGFFEYDKFLYSEYTQKLYVLNLDVKSNKVLSYQTRNFDNVGPKYLTFKLNKMYEEIKKECPVDNEVFDKLDELSIFFNLTNVDVNRPVTFFEGPIDAYLFKNGISLNSIHTHIPFELGDTRYLFDFDSEGSKKSKKLLKEKRYVFMWRKILRDYKIEWIEGGKIDFNDLITELRKKKEYKVDFNKYFTNSPLDLLWI